ncbi:MAG: hypothetical protein AAF371_02605 [Pseudomonadota bacterium]
MKLSAETLRGAYMAFGRTRPTLDEANRQAALQGHLCEEVLAVLLLREKVLSDEPGLAAQLAEVARNSHASVATARSDLGDLGALRAGAADAADALDALVALDEALVAAERNMAPGHAVGLRQAGDAIDVLTDALLPSEM